MIKEFIKKCIRKLTGTDEYIALLAIYVEENYKLQKKNEELNRMLRKAYLRGIEYAKKEIQQQSQSLLNNLCEEYEINIDDLVDITGEPTNETN